MENSNIPKFKIGEMVEANWAGGHVTKQIISGIENKHHGFWYTWDEDDKKNDFGNGLYERYLNKCYR